MPLICAFGVGNIGKEVLKTFPIAFAWVASENEEMYEWFISVFKEIVGSRYLRDTVFVTDKCAALMNQLDAQFPDNKKLLCTWHMIRNMSKHATIKIFSAPPIAKSVKDIVFSMVNCTDTDIYLDLKEALDTIFSEPLNFVSEKAQKSFCD